MHTCCKQDGWHLPFKTCLAAGHIMERRILVYVIKLVGLVNVAIVCNLYKIEMVS